MPSQCGRKDKTERKSVFKCIQISLDIHKMTYFKYSMRLNGFIHQVLSIQELILNTTALSFEKLHVILSSFIS